MLTEPNLRRVPAAFAERARAFYRDGATAVEPRRAATVMVLRDLPHVAGACGGIEVYLIRRRPTMAFAGGLYAFPGGGVDPADIDVQSAALREVREETGLRLRELHAWSRWITPEFEPRRYDTWFYVARQPDDVQPQDVGGEADWVGWLSPAEALRDHGADMLPPTAVALSELSRHLTVDSVLAAAEERDLSPVLPRIRLDDGAARICLPGDPDYPA
ncbi:ADP-ribose pyrophosphatase YjhB (NUDIX family) [Stackebrandtia albiflava]|uniref:ADP-ribose pyrophosphatase YjhB (NUDIX family) n=1 Tax=Stackebrandtia albiflava TaxID=406432 RepID=A0A562V1D5_9ACTN|nr:NUDIX hydrolase [Stackebrandtia albiflava]TWJ11633.1 ADP-ribose pyrophosphatase YjhB (NUDIX family) [Stackebrandtia albiflava]